MGVAPSKLETNPPRPIYGHSPLARTCTLQLVQPDALERAQVAERLGDVQSQQQIEGGIEVQAAKAVRRFTVPDFSAHRIAP